VSSDHRTSIYVESAEVSRVCGGSDLCLFQHLNTPTLLLEFRECYNLSWLQPRGGTPIVGQQDNVHEASAAATGYLFQCRYALLVGLQAIPNRPQLDISVEKFDDIAFSQSDEPLQLIQTKHHVQKTGALSDTSNDLWKTLLIWTKNITRDPTAVLRMSFVLLTTGHAPHNSAASYLRMADRDEEKADLALMKAATESMSKSNSDSYTAYKALPQNVRLAFLKAVLILDGSPNIHDVHQEIIQEVYHAAPRSQIANLVQRLEGWWFQVVINALSGVGPSAIPVMAIDQRVDELREEFKRTALPIDFARAFPSPEVVAELDGRPFVKQLRQIEVGPRRIEYAIRDFYRASEQRSRWAREDLLVGDELDNYERELVEAWQPRHAAVVDELTLKDDCDVADRVKAGQEIFKWVETEAIFPLRSVRDHFLTHGSYHILANRYAVGWHPDYMDWAPTKDDK
jgi:hypothetical protein